MIGYGQIEMAKATCAFHKKWGMYINIHWDDRFEADVFLAAPYLRDNDTTLQLVSDGCGVLLFESREDMERAYNQTVGDDGPTELNKYDGKHASVYALTIGPDGTTYNENT